MEKRILVTGGSGLLGIGLYLSQNRPNNTFFTYFHDDFMSRIASELYFKIDVSNKEDLKKFFVTKKITHVIHAASNGNIDYCEKNKSNAYRINVESTKLLLDLSKEFNFKIIYISSNAVFDGLKAPYFESSKANPQNYYGLTKLQSEKIVMSDKNNLVIRLLLMYGWNAPNQRLNPLTWILQELLMKNKLYLVDDIYNNPISNFEAADSLWKLVEKETSGVINIAGKDRVSRYEFGIEVAEVFGLNKDLIENVSSDYFPNMVKRMPDTTYNIDKLRLEIGFEPLDLENSLKKIKKNKPSWIK